MKYSGKKPYLTATIAVLLAWAFQAAVGPHFGRIFAFAPFLLAAMFAAWTGGLRPALLALITGFLISSYLYVTPGTLLLRDRDGLAAFAVYALVGVATGLLADSCTNQRQRAEAASERLKAALLSIGDAVITTDEQERTVTLNPVAEELTGWTAAEAAGRPLDEVFRILHEHTGEPVESPAAKVIQQGRIIGLGNHTILVSKDGPRIPIDDSAAPIYDNGRLAGVVLVFRDVTERRRSEQRLQAQYEIASTLAEAKEETAAVLRVLEIVCRNLDWKYAAFWKLDPDRNVLRCGGHLHRDSGMEESPFAVSSEAQTFPIGSGLPGSAWQKASPMWIADVAEADNFPRAEAAIKEGLHGAFAAAAFVGDRVLGVMEFFSAEVREPDEDLLQAMRAVGSQLGQFLERRRAALALEQTAGRNAAILDAALDCIITIDHEGRVLDFNPAAERVFGYTREEAVGRTMAELIVPERLQEQHREGLARIVQTGEGRILGRRLVMPAVRKGGEEFPVELSITRVPAEGPPLFTGYLRDLSEQYRAEAERRESEQRNTLLAELTSDYTVSCSVREDGSIVLDHVSEGFTQITGFTLDELQAAGGWQAICLPEEMPAIEESIAELLSGNDSELHVRLKTKSGDVRWIHSLARPVVDEDRGRVTRIYVASQDVTDERKAEESLKLNARVLENMTEGVAVTDAHGYIVLTNPAEDEMFGYERGELIGQHMSTRNAYPPEENRRIVAEVIEELKEQGIWSGEWENRRKDGTTFTTESSITSLRMRDELFFVCVQRDVTEQKKAEAALRESERNAKERLSLLNHVYNTAPVGMGLVDRELRYVRINQLLATMDGHTPEECIGRTLREVIPELADQLEALYRQVLESGEPVLKREVTGVTPGTSGEQRHWLVNYHPVRGSDGSVMAVSSAVLDITDRKRAEDALRASEERFRSMADSAPVMIWVSDTEKALTWFNKPWRDFTGRSLEQELGFGWTEGVHKDDLARCLEIYTESFDARKEFRMEYRLRRRDGEYRWVIEHGTPLYGNGHHFAGYIGSAIDIHDHRLTEQALRDADNRKNEFMAMLAHELRNPLAVIQYTAQLSRLTAARDEELKFATTVEAQVRHLARLVDDLLDLSRLTRGKITLRTEDINAADAVKKAADAMQPLVQERRHELALEIPDEPLLVHADETRLAQVIQNLITNAAKYTEPGGRIEVALKRENGEARISVTDNGMGMPPELVPHVFDLFRQGDRTLDRSQGGLGIGLTLVREIVELHGGTVSARSPGVGLGSTFTIRLPLVQAQTSAGVANDEQPPTAQQPLRVFVVEDNVDAARGLQLLLQAAGHETAVCHSGTEALEAAKEFRPDAVLLDIGLPGKDGYQVARELRGDEDLKDVLLIAISGYGENQDDPSHGSEIDHRLVKPVSFDAVQFLLDREIRDGS